jgi:hypothetical protein
MKAADKYVIKSGTYNGVLVRDHHDITILAERFRGRKPRQIIFVAPCTRSTEQDKGSDNPHCQLTKKASVSERC